MPGLRKTHHAGQSRSHRDACEPASPALRVHGLYPRWQSIPRRRSWHGPPGASECRPTPERAQKETNQHEHEDGKREMDAAHVAGSDEHDDQDCNCQYGATDEGSYITAPRGLSLWHAIRRLTPRTFHCLEERGLLDARGWYGVPENFAQWTRF